MCEVDLGEMPSLAGMDLPRTAVHLYQHCRPFFLFMGATCKDNYQRVQVSSETAHHTMLCAEKGLIMGNNYRPCISLMYWTGRFNNTTSPSSSCHCCKCLHQSRLQPLLAHILCFGWCITSNRLIRQILWWCTSLRYGECTLQPTVCSMAHGHSYLFLWRLCDSSSE